MSQAQMIEAINNARLTEQEKQTAIAALATAERLVGAIEWIRTTVGAIGGGRAIETAPVRS
jgi:hypothetical protein